jgi:hypothetical protein
MYLPEMWLVTYSRALTDQAALRGMSPKMVKLEKNLLASRKTDWE